MPSLLAHADPLQVAVADEHLGLDHRIWKQAGPGSGPGTRAEAEAEAVVAVAAGVGVGIAVAVAVDAAAFAGYEYRVGQRGEEFAADTPEDEEENHLFQLDQSVPDVDQAGGNPERPWVVEASDIPPEEARGGPGYVNHAA